jgi:CheY-like chemotaxis protein
MDCNMPFIDGYHATREIRKLYMSMDISKELQPKIVAVTGHVENEYV